MSKSNRVSDVYYGETVSAYERERQDPKWESENAAFAQLLTLVAPREIADCPIGTGRWLSFYEGGVDLEGVPVRGFDASLDMLSETGRKARSLGLEIELRKLNIFEDRVPPFAGDAGLLVSTRFLNWVHPSEVLSVIDSYCASGARWMIVSLRYDLSGSFFVKVRPLILHFFRKRVLFVHDRERLVKRMESKGYGVQKEVVVARSKYTVFSYFLFTAERE